VQSVRPSSSASLNRIILVHKDPTQYPLAHLVTADPVIGLIESDFLQGMTSLWPDLALSN